MAKFIINYTKRRIISEDLLSFLKVELKPLKCELLLLEGFPRNKENLE